MPSVTHWAQSRGEQLAELLAPSWHFYVHWPNDAVQLVTEAPFTSESRKGLTKTIQMYFYREGLTKTIQMHFYREDVYVQRSETNMWENIQRSKICQNMKQNPWFSQHFKVSCRNKGILGTSQWCEQAKAWWMDASPVPGEDRETGEHHFLFSICAFLQPPGCLSALLLTLPVTSSLSVAVVSRTPAPLGRPVEPPRASGSCRLQDKANKHNRAGRYG